MHRPVLGSPLSPSRRRDSKGKPVCLDQRQQCNNLYECGDYSDEVGCFAFSPAEQPLRPGAAGSPFTQGYLHWKTSGEFKLLSVEFDRGDGPVFGVYHDLAAAACKELLPGFRGTPYVTVQKYK